MDPPHAAHTAPDGKHTHAYDRTCCITSCTSSKTSRLQGANWVTSDARTAVAYSSKGRALTNFDSPPVAVPYACCWWAAECAEPRCQCQAGCGAAWVLGWDARPHRRPCRAGMLAATSMPPGEASLVPRTVEGGADLLSFEWQRYFRPHFSGMHVGVLTCWVRACDLQAYCRDP
jgi:hypothetical protein